MFLKKEMYVLGVVLLALNSCGSSSNSSTSNLTDTTNTPSTKVGYVIDAPVGNLTYKCGDKTAKTQSDGKFECTILPATFSIGNIEIGSITTINSDTKVFVQDILKVERSDFNNTKVLKLAILLQSLDKDKNSSTSISIPNDINLSSTKSFDDLSLAELNSLLTTAGFTPVSSVDAEQHLREFSDIDTLVPTLTLNGKSTLSISKNESYKELGAIAKDDRDKNLTVMITGTVKTDTVGSYVISYNVSDKAGNKAKTLTRTVTVKNILPTISNAEDLNISKAGEIAAVLFNNTGGDITSCSISPDLPTGLTLASDCKITGTVSGYQNTTAYTITATNNIGSVSVTINIKISIPYTANDDLLEDQWYIKNTGTAPDTWGKFTTLTKDADLNVTAAWNQNTTGKGIVVTVVDDGADFTHPDLVNQEKKGFLYDVQTGSKTELTLPITDEGNTDHGTACAGIIAAEGNNGGVVGIAPNAELTAHRFIEITEQNGDVHPYEKILDDNVSQVSNHSYGYAGNGILYPEDTEEYDLMKALVTQANGGKGHVMVFASGNDRDSGASNSEKYGDYAGLDMIQQNPYIICVSGFGATDQEISYAEAGPAVLVAGATGESFTYFSNNSIKPLTASMATTGRTTINYAEGTESFRDGGTDEPTGYNMAFDGTSAAAPTVTGIVALILSANPELTWRDVRWILAKTARKIQLDGKVINQASGEESNENYWSSTGNSIFGRYSHYFGYGAANAGAAVTLAKSPSYTLLPAQKECEVIIDDGVSTVSSECPKTVEFVRVKFGIKANTNINEMTFSMRLNNNRDKEVLLLRPSYCALKGENACNVTNELNVTSGTVGFLGDTLKENDTFNFSVTDAKTSSEVIVPHSITIMGYDK